MKKKIISVICLLIVCLSGVLELQSHLLDRPEWSSQKEIQTVDHSVSGQTVEEPDHLYAHAAVLMDADSGRILFAKNADEQLPMASTTKIMTCILALETMEDNQETEVSQTAASQPKVHLGAGVGEHFLIRDLLYSMMLESHNDSAVMVAEGIAGTVEEFIAMMNRKADELGCSSTYFLTPNGLDASNEAGTHATTAADLARIMKYCIMDSPKKDLFLKITGTRTYEFSNLEQTHVYLCTNHNRLLDMLDCAISGKTGFTSKAGYCYVGAARDRERTFIVALLACGWPGNKNYKWSDSRKLLEYGLKYYDYRNVWKEPDQNVLPVKHRNGFLPGMDQRSEAAIGIENDPGEWNLLLRKDENVECRTILPESLEAPVRKGQVVGKVEYLLQQQIIRTCRITAKEAVKEQNFLWLFKHFCRSFFTLEYIDLLLESC